MDISDGPDQWQDDQLEERYVTEKTALWDLVCKTDPKATKEFRREGGFKGTATNATWLAKRATEVFGPMGIGWGIDVVDESIIPGGAINETDREMIHKVRIKLWYNYGDARGEITHFGQTMLVGKNKYGVYTDEEAPKKSLTDAMSKCLSMLGFAADVHMGLFDDNKYVAAMNREFHSVEKKPSQDQLDRIGKINTLAELLEEFGRLKGDDIELYRPYFSVRREELESA